jgi:hypothetical protein
MDISEKNEEESSADIIIDDRGALTDRDRQNEL